MTYLYKVHSNMQVCLIFANYCWHSVDIRWNWKVSLADNSDNVGWLPSFFSLSLSLSLYIYTHTHIYILFHINLFLPNKTYFLKGSTLSPTLQVQVGRYLDKFKPVSLGHSPDSWCYSRNGHVTELGPLNLKGRIYSSFVHFSLCSSFPLHVNRKAKQNKTKTLSHALILLP